MAVGILRTSEGFLDYSNVIHDEGQMTPQQLQQEINKGKYVEKKQEMPRNESDGQISQGNSAFLE